MDTKTYLKQIERLDRQIQNKLSERVLLKSIALNISAPMKNDKITSTKHPDRLGDTVAKIVDLEKEIDALVDKYIDRRKTIISQIDRIDDTDMYHVLSLRYVAKKNFPEISEQTGWSLRQTKRIHGRALETFESTFGYSYL